MCALVNIQMPIKYGSSVRGDVIGAFLNQTVDWEIYINLEDEKTFKIDEEILQVTSESQEDKKDIEARIQIARKRNMLVDKGESPYVYLADADVLLNDEANSEIFNDVFGELVMGLERHPRLGAVGLPYQAGYHVGAGSMMLRRSDLLQIGDIRGAGSFCTCGYISHKLLHAGLYTVPLRTMRAKHVKVYNEGKQTSEPKLIITIILPDDIPSSRQDKVVDTGKAIYYITKNEMKELLIGKIEDIIKKGDNDKCDMAILSNYEIEFQSAQ
jgi:hypothetical protein